MNDEKGKREDGGGGAGSSLRIINAELRGLRDLSLEPRVSRVPLDRFCRTGGSRFSRDP